MQPASNVPETAQTQSNQTAEPVQTAAPANQPYKQTQVTYRETTWQRNNPKNQYSAILEWGADNRIRLYAYHYNGQEKVTLVDCQPQEIQKFSTGMGTGNIKLRDGRSFSLEFSAQVRDALLVSGVAQNFDALGMVAATMIDKNAVQLETKTDIEWWIETLKKFGVGGLQMTAKSAYTIDKAGWWGLGIFIGLIVLFMLIAGVIYLISAMGIA